MQDGRPTPRHVYQGLQVDETRGNFIMASRAFWKCRLDGSGWVKYQDGGRTPFAKVTGELIWSFLDETTGKLWQGGCGSNCWQEGYYFYGAAQIYDPADNSVTTSPGLVPDHVPGNVANLGDQHLFVVKAGRTIYAIMRSGYSISANLDDLTTGRTLYRPPVAEGYAGNTDEGNAVIALGASGTIWAVDTHDPALPTWEYDFAAATPGEPLDDGYGNLVPTKVPTARRVPIAQCGRPPAAAVLGLVYSRMEYWPAGGVVVYVPSADDNVWVMRPAP
jgi:hypothetical protein